METIERLSGDVLDINNDFDTYTEYKAAVDAELQRSAESFVRIGYLLKVARDTDILKDSGYGNVNEFAEKEYSLDKSQVSRFIRINDEFSENGYSDKLQERYRTFGYAKLALMLMLPAAVNEELTADYTKAEINMIKEEVAEEKRKTDLEVMMEEKDQGQQAFNSLGKFLYEYGRDAEAYLNIYEALDPLNDKGIKTPDMIIGSLLDVLAPAGEGTIILRIAGEGKKMLSIKGPETDLVLVDIRKGEKQTYTWEQMIEQVDLLCSGGATGKRAWEYIYGMPFPEKKEEVAPVQPQKEKISRVSRVRTVKKPEKTIEETKPEEKADDKKEETGKREDQAGHDEAQGTPSAAEPDDAADGASTGTGETDTTDRTDDEERGVAPVQPEEQLEGQMNITQFPEYMPEAQDIAGGVHAAGSSTNADDIEEHGSEPGPIMSQDGMEEHIKRQSELINRDLYKMIRQCSDREWTKLIETAKGIIERVEGIERMIKVYEQ